MLLAGVFAGCSGVNFPRGAASQFNRTMALGAFDHSLLSRAIFAESNRARLAHGVPPLETDPRLDAAADEQATYMALVLRAEHDNAIPGEHAVTDRVAREGLIGNSVAENVLMMQALRPVPATDRNYTYASYATFLVDAWMNSPGHRANLLNPDFGYLGCAARLARGILPGDQRIFASQVFLDPNARDTSHLGQHPK